jgi:hypothetical protein
MADVENKIRDGDVGYPNSTRSTGNGMEFELR